MKTLIIFPEGRGGIAEIGNDLAEVGIDDFDFYKTSPERTRSVFGLLKMAYDFAKFVAARSPEVAILNLASRGSFVRKFMISLVLRHLSVPYIIHLHGGGFDNFYREAGGPLQTLIRYFFSRAQGALVLGEIWRRFLIEELRLESAKVLVLENAVRTTPQNSRIATFENNKSVPLEIMFAGRVEASKGIGDLLNALSHLTDFEWHLSIAGSGEVEHFKSEAHRLGLAERVSFLGWLPRKELTSLLRRSSIFCLPSHVENQPLALLEAMAEGCASVATLTGTVSEIVRKHPSALIGVAVGDSENLKIALGSLMREPLLLISIGQSARAVVHNHYNFSSYPDKLRNRVKQLLSVD